MSQRPAKCLDCGLPYNDPGFADLFVPHDVWAKIGPTGHEGGLLCPTCMVRAAEKAGVGSVLAKFTSGPFACDLPKVTHEEWLIACAAWNNVTPEFMKAECKKNDQRMPAGSRAAWARVFEAVRDYYGREG